MLLWRQVLNGELLLEEVKVSQRFLRYRHREVHLLQTRPVMIFIQHTHRQWYLGIKLHATFGHPRRAGLRESCHICQAIVEMHFTSSLHWSIETGFMDSFVTATEVYNVEWTSKLLVSVRSQWLLDLLIPPIPIRWSMIEEQFYTVDWIWETSSRKMAFHENEQKGLNWDHI